MARWKGYKLKPIFKDWAIYPILLCAIGYVYLESTIWHGDYSLIKYSAYFKVIYLSCFIILAIKHEQFKSLFYSLPLVWLGYGLNFIAVKANGGKMPVFPSVSFSTGYVKPEMFIDSARFGDFHVLGNAQTKLIPFCDIFDFSYSIMSLGDLLIRAFAFIIIYSVIKSINTKSDKNNNKCLTV